MSKEFIPSMLLTMILLAAFSIPGVSAQEVAYFTPSKLAKEMVRTELGLRSGESEEDRAGRAIAAEIEAEKALRLGYTYQEARARLRQSLRLEVSVGAENGKRMAAKLAKAERKNSVGRTGTGLGAETDSGKSTGKDKKGR